MSVLKTEKLGLGQAWGLWQITETEESLSSLIGESCPSDIAHSQKRMEWLAGRALLKHLSASIGLRYQGTGKDAFGKPTLTGHAHQISLSHSFPLVAAQIDPLHPVGIDVEQPKEKLRAVAHRVFREEEIEDAGDSLIKLCIYWSAKEALYKIYGKRQLLFTDHLAVDAFNLADEGMLKGRIFIEDSRREYDLRYYVMNEYVIVATSPPACS